MAGGPLTVRTTGPAIAEREMRVLVINDFVRKGGAEEVYRTSVDVLRALPGVDAEGFDERSVATAPGSARRAWNPAAARALAATIERVQPQRVLVHNYHSLLSPSILPVIQRYKRKLGYRTFLTCHDYHMVFYNPNLLTYPQPGVSKPLPLEALGDSRRLLACASAHGLLHDAAKKLHWHAVNMLLNPSTVFDQFLCPSPYMREALARRGITRSAILSNPVNTHIAPAAPRILDKDRFDLAFVGRIEPEKGLDPFLELASHTQWHRLGSVTLYGDGSQRDALRTKYTTLIDSGRLRFAGRLDHAQLFEALRAHDAVLLPSIWAENAPLVIVEAAMIGLPVLVHDLGSLASFGDEIGNKIKYQRTPASLVAALDALGMHLRDTQRRYDWSQYTREHYAARLSDLLDLRAGIEPDTVRKWA
ncbi:glycosyltransferase family 4 protein [Mycetohabitans sp. B46]|uniref:glycosyltransferase family 4 protein n=1 Tax=Mycetohabitans sp. B46 TaxID=2772536 RepID=UPI00307D3688